MKVELSDHAGGASVSFGELPLVLTVDEARRVLRIGRRQLYQAIARRDVHTRSRSAAASGSLVRASKRG
jgi:hypothetical protein